MGTVREITLQPISEPIQRHCPECGRPVLCLYPESAQVVGQRHWLFDGDTIPGLWRRLQSGGKDLPPISYYANVAVGRCPGCGEHYFVVEVAMIAAEVDDDFEHVYFRLNGDRGTERNHLARYLGTVSKASREWTVASIETLRGGMFHHCLGPFPLEDPESIIGPYGVAPCQGNGAGAWQFASDLVFELWDDLVALAFELPGAARLE
jgi:hypothetical protein